VSQLLVLGINHETAPVAVRERVAFAQEALPQALIALKALPQVQEVALLSTCNRTELYAVAGDGGEVLGEWLATHPGDAAGLHAYLYRHADGDAVRHLFRVASGLDSLVLGEPQILGQVKQAWIAARAAGTLGSRLDRLFQHAFTTAKRTRTETRIGASPVSVASTAVRLLQESFARPSEATVLLIGAGETIELAARHLVQAKVARLLVTNRTLAHAQELASRHGGYALPLDELDRHLAEADVVISATASRDPVIARAHVEAALHTRKHRPMLLIDLAVPRTSPSCVTPICTPSTICSARSRTTAAPGAKPPRKPKRSSNCRWHAMPARRPRVPAPHHSSNCAATARWRAPNRSPRRASSSLQASRRNRRWNFWPIH
jgi:glutamyl-tRNA reductase